MGGWGNEESFSDYTVLYGRAVASYMYVEQEV